MRILKPFLQQTNYKHRIQKYDVWTIVFFEENITKIVLRARLKMTSSLLWYRFKVLFQQKSTKVPTLKKLDKRVLKYRHMRDVIFVEIQFYVLPLNESRKFGQHLLSRIENVTTLFGVKVRVVVAVVPNGRHDDHLREVRVRRRRHELVCHSEHLH